MHTILFATNAKIWAVLQSKRCVFVFFTKKFRQVLALAKLQAKLHNVTQKNLPVTLLSDILTGVKDC